MINKNTNALSPDSAERIFLGHKNNLRFPLLPKKFMEIEMNSFFLFAGVSRKQKKKKRKKKKKKKRNLLFTAVLDRREILVSK